MCQYGKSFTTERQSSGMDTKQTQRNVLVTGTTSGIGRAVARRFAKASARVIGFGRDRAALKKVEQEVADAGGTPLMIAADVTIDTELQNAFESAIDRVGRLDVLINGAGHISTGSIEDAT